MVGQSASHWMERCKSCRPMTFRLFQQRQTPPPFGTQTEHFHLRFRGRDPGQFPAIPTDNGSPFSGDWPFIVQIVQAVISHGLGTPRTGSRRVIQQPPGPAMIAGLKQQIPMWERMVMNENGKSHAAHLSGPEQMIALQSGIRAMGIARMVWNTQSVAEFPEIRST